MIYSTYSIRWNFLNILKRWKLINTYVKQTFLYDHKIKSWYTKEKKLIDFQDRSVNSCIKKFIEWVNRNKHILSLRRIWRSKTKYKKNIKLKSTCWTDQIKPVKADLFFYFLIFFCTWQVQCFFIIWKYFGDEDNTGECSKKTLIDELEN